MKNLLLLLLLLLIPLVAISDPATESTQQGVKGVLQDQTEILEQIEANTAGNGSITSIRMIYQNEPDGCLIAYFVGSSTKVISRFPAIVIAGGGLVSEIPLFDVSNDLAERRDVLLALFNFANGTSFTLADATDANGILNCGLLNKSMLGIT